MLPVSPGDVSARSGNILAALLWVKQNVKL
jgi:hypothetical protein